VESNKLFKLDDNTLKERLLEGLVEIYSRGHIYGISSPAGIIAQLCDEYLDRSGNLLGEIRKESLKRRRIKESDEHLSRREK